MKGAYIGAEGELISGGRLQLDALFLFTGGKPTTKGLITGGRGGGT